MLVLTQYHNCQHPITNRHKFIKFLSCSFVNNSRSAASFKNYLVISRHKFSLSYCTVRNHKILMLCLTIYLPYSWSSHSMFQSSNHFFFLVLSVLFCNTLHSSGIVLTWRYDYGHITPGYSQDLSYSVPYCTIQ